jgi:hypothetical protein
MVGTHIIISSTYIAGSCMEADSIAPILNMFQRHLCDGLMVAFCVGTIMYMLPILLVVNENTLCYRLIKKRYACVGQLLQRRMNTTWMESMSCMLSYALNQPSNIISCFLLRPTFYS